VRQVKFILMVTAFLLVFAGVYGILRLIYHHFVRSPFPVWIFWTLIVVSVFGCLLRFIYRFSYEGFEVEGQPAMYGEVLQWLDTYAFLGFFTAWVLFWHVGPTWWGWAWAGMYGAGEMAVGTVSDKRKLVTALRIARIMFPEKTPEEQQAKARIWVESGLDPFVYEYDNPGQRG